MVRLVLKGSNKTFDSLHTDYKAEDYSFTILANTFKDRTKQEWDKKYLLSFVKMVLKTHACEKLMRAEENHSFLFSLNRKFCTFVPERKVMV